jgi:CheY-like chemotaxis protein
MSTPMKVLLAEDDKDDQIFFNIFLSERADIELLPPLMNGAEVLDALQTIAVLPDFIILDHNMPKLNGLQTLQQLKADPRYSTIPVILYSTYVDENLINKGLEAGAADVITKPTDNIGYNKMMDNYLYAKK